MHDILKVCKVLLVHKDFKDPWENLETLDLPVLLDQMEQEACPDCLAKMVNLEEMANPDLRDHLALLEKEVFLECLVFLDPRVIVDFLVWMEPKEAREDLVKREKKALQDQMGHKDPWGLLDQEEKEDVKVLLVLLV